MDTLETILAACQNLEKELAARDGEIENLKAQVHDLEADLESVSNYAEQLRMERKEEKKELANLQATHESLQLAHDLRQLRHFNLEEQLLEETQVSQSMIKDLQSRVDSFEEQAAAKAARDPSRVTKRDLVHQIEALEAAAAKKDSLYQVGVKVRLRFLQLARSAYRLKGRYDEEITLDGNKAAHEGNAALDRQLFDEGALPESVRKRYLSVFQTIYESNLKEFDSMPQSLVETLDCEVTIRTLRVLSKDRLINERQSFFSHIDFIKERYRKESKEAFESDAGVQQRVGWVREFTAKIVEAERKEKSAKLQGGNNSHTKGVYPETKTSHARRGSRSSTTNYTNSSPDPTMVDLPSPVPKEWLESERQEQS